MVVAYAGDAVDIGEVGGGDFGPVGVFAVTQNGGRQGQGGARAGVQVAHRPDPGGGVVATLAGAGALEGIAAGQLVVNDHSGGGREVGGVVHGHREGDGVADARVGRVDGLGQREVHGGHGVGRGAGLVVVHRVVRVVVLAVVLAVAVVVAHSGNAVDVGLVGGGDLGPVLVSAGGVTGHDADGHGQGGVGPLGQRAHRPDPGGGVVATLAGAGADEAVTGG